MKIFWIPAFALAAFGIAAVLLFADDTHHGLGVLSLPAAESGQMHEHAHGAAIDVEEHPPVEAMHPDDDAHGHSHDGHAH